MASIRLRAECASSALAQAGLGIARARVLATRLRRELTAWHACLVRSTAPRARGSVVRAGYAVAVTVLLGVNVLREARADEHSPAGPVALEWTAPPECPTRDEMFERITRTIGKTEGTPDPVRAWASALQEESGDWRGEVELSAFGQTATRSVHGNSCRAVSDALALIIALVVNPDAPPAIPPEPRTTPDASPPPANVAPPAPARRHPRFIFGASGLIDTGTLPSPSYGGEVYAGWTPGRPELEVVGAGLSTVNGMLASRPGQGASFWLAHVGGRGCYELLDRAFNLAPCVGLGGEWIVAKGFGSSQPANGTAVLAVTSLGARTRARLSRHFALSIGVEAVVPLARPSFDIDNAGTVFHVPWALFRASGGAELHF
jgi:hypothetical protein